MFQSARLKLTAWYLLIIASITFAFSIVIFRMLSSEVDRFAAAQQYRIQRQLNQDGLFVPRGFPPIDTDLVEETKQHLLLNILFVDGVILLVTGGLGYLLAGKTLKPIQQMLDDQNRFISDSSHELRTPLTSLKSAMEVSLRDPRFNIKDAKSLIAESIGEVDKLSFLANDLLKLARHQHKTKTISLKAESLTGILEMSLQRVIPQAKKKKIKIDKEITECQVNADKNDLSDLFVILLDNAIKYSPVKSTISVAAKCEDNHIIIKVRDQGIGIDQKDLPHIFERFYRADTARSKTDAGGFGLGLSIAKNIIDLHHGTITVDSQVNQGSVFTVTLPLFS